MKDPRFLPIEKREPVEDEYDDFFESEELTEYLLQQREKSMLRRFDLYVAS